MTSYPRPLQNGSATQEWVSASAVEPTASFPSRGQKRRRARDDLSLTWIILGFVRRVSELNVKVDVEDGVVVVVPWN